MFKFIILFLIVQPVFSIDEQVISISEHPLFTKLLGIVDQLLIQVRNLKALVTRTFDLFDRMPNDLHPLFDECFTTTRNASRIQYSLSLNEAEITRIPQIKDQLNQAKTLQQQLNVINMTDRILADITLNVCKPSLSFITEILDCFRNKIPRTIA